jgi:acyl-CoA thioesterase FadM
MVMTMMMISNAIVLRPYVLVAVIIITLWHRTASGFLLMAHPSTSSHGLRPIALDDNLQAATINGDFDVLTTSTSSEAAASTAVVTFQSDPIQVYIEDTDAYGVMYNSNVLRGYDRALHRASFLPHNIIATTTATTTRQGSPVVLLKHNRWSITGFQTLKYRLSLTLGDSYIVRGTLAEVTSTHQIWNMETVGLDNTTVYSTITGVTISDGPGRNDGDGGTWLLPTEPLPIPDGTPVNIQSMHTHRDEFDPHLSTHLSLANVFNFWERSRSNAFGGPDALKRLQVEDGIFVVVTGCTNVSLVEHSQDALVAGDDVVIETAIELKRRECLLDFHHTAYSHGERIAQGVVTCLAIDTQTKRPIRALPDWVKQNLARSSKQ